MWSVKETLTLLSWRPWRHQEVRRRWWRQRRGANKRRSDTTCQRIGLVRDCYASWRNSRSSFHSGSSARIMGNLTTGPAVKSHISPKRARELIAKKSNSVPFVVPGLSTSSSTTPTPTSSSLSSQDSVFDVNRDTENPVPERSGSMSEELRGNPLHKPTEIEKTKIKMKDAKKGKAIYCMTCRIGCRISEKFWSMKVVL